MKNVAVIVHRYLSGGAERITERLVKALRPGGFRFTLFTNETVAEPKNFDHVHVYPTRIRGFNESATRAIAKEIAPLCPDIVWLIGDDYDRLDLLRPAMAPQGKIIYHLHSIPFFQVGLKTSKAVAMIREKVFHTYTRRYRRRTAATLRNVDSYITLCNGYARQLQHLYPDEADKIQAIYNPAPETSFNPQPKQREIIYVGRLSYADKRVDNLLRIFARVAPTHPDWTLKIIGDGPARPALEELARKLEFNQVQFLGYQPKINMSESTIICLTSVVEGWGMSLVEGMQQGVVPIAFNCSAGVEELLSDGRGILVEPDNIDEYARKLTELMDSPELRSKILATHQTFLQKLDIHNILKHWLPIFE